MNNNVAELLQGTWLEGTVSQSTSAQPADSDAQYLTLTDVPPPDNRHIDIDIGEALQAQSDAWKVHGKIQRTLRTVGWELSASHVSSSKIAGRLRKLW